MAENKPTPILRLIALPALITLGVTILRLEGELHHWSSLWFNTAAGGGAALVGISWLPIIFGPYFALKLAHAGEGPSTVGKAAIYTLIGLAVFLAGGIWFALTLIKHPSHPSNLAVLAIPVMLAAAFIPRMGWRSLGNTLIAYAFAARIPVLIVMFFAMRGKGGLGWGTHYDATGPGLPTHPFALKFLEAAILPQMGLWIGYTVILAAILGVVATAVVRPGRRPAHAEV